MRTLGKQPGDTIIEVLLAVTVFSLVAVGGLTIMNQGMNTAQQAVELTQVKQQIDSQAAAIRAAHDAALGDTPATWDAINRDTGTASSLVVDAPNGTKACAAIPSSAFVMNPRTGTVHTTAPQGMDDSATIPYAGIWYEKVSDTTPTQVAGIWVESSMAPRFANFPNARDFRIRACWYVPGSPMLKTLETLVRVYEP